MRAEYDFSQGRRGAVRPSPGKTRITIRIDDDVLQWFRDLVISQEGGSYQSMMNDVLRHYVLGQHEPLEDTLRRVLREEMAQYAVREESR